MIVYLDEGDYKFIKGGKVIDSTMPILLSTKFALFKLKLPKQIEEFNIKYNEFIKRGQVWTVTTKPK